MGSKWLILKSTYMTRFANRADDEFTDYFIGKWEFDLFYRFHFHGDETDEYRRKLFIIL